MLLGVWRIAVPGLIMQMIGDADSTPNIKIEKELLQGISDAAVASGKVKKTVRKIHRRIFSNFRCMDYYKWLQGRKHFRADR